MLQFGHLKVFDAFVPKILKAFCTLSSSPELAKHVRKLGDPTHIRRIHDTDGRP